MSIPLLNRRLVLEAPVVAPDGAGGQIESWVAMGTLWAEIRPKTGREATGEAGAMSVRAFRITVRGAPPGASNRPLPGQRFRQQTRLFRIVAVTEAEPGGLYLTCEAREEVAA